jgi:hypothetical protein
MIERATTKEMSMTMNDRKTNLKYWNAVHVQFIQHLHIDDVDQIFLFGSFMAMWVEQFERFPTMIELQQFKYTIMQVK